MREQSDKEITEILFKDFWKNYPKKEGKKVAWDKFNRLDINTQRIVADHVKKRAKSDAKWIAGFTPMASTFFNQQRWHDEYEVADKISGRPRPNREVKQPTPCVKCRSDNITQRHFEICEKGMPYYDIKKGDEYYKFTGSGMIRVI